MPLACLKFHESASASRPIDRSFALFACMASWQGGCRSESTLLCSYVNILDISVYMLPIDLHPDLDCNTPSLN